MEVGRDDGRVQMRRCLEAMTQTADIETRRSLWRAAVRYSQRDRGERPAGPEKNSRPLACAGGTLAHDWMEW